MGRMPQRKADTTAASKSRMNSIRSGTNWGNGRLVAPRAAISLILLIAVSAGPARSNRAPEPFRQVEILFLHQRGIARALRDLPVGVRGVTAAGGSPS